MDHTSQQAFHLCFDERESASLSRSSDRMRNRLTSTDVPFSHPFSLDRPLPVKLETVSGGERILLSFSFERSSSGEDFEEGDLLNPKSMSINTSAHAVQLRTETCERILTPKDHTSDVLSSCSSPRARRGERYSGVPQAMAEINGAGSETLSGRVHFCV